MQETLRNRVFISTRPTEKSQHLKSMFEDSGAQLLEFPTIEIAPLTLSPVDIEILKKIDHLDWIIFTSANGVRFFFQKMRELKQELPEIKMAVIGSKTQKSLENFGFKADFTGPTSDLKEFVSALKNEIGPHRPNALWITGSLSPASNEELLNEVVNIVRVNVYQTRPALEVDAEVQKRISDGNYDMLFFYSPSAIFNFMEMVKNKVHKNDLKVGCIGPTTEKACNSLGINPILVATEASDEGIFEAAEQYYTELKHTKY